MMYEAGAPYSQMGYQYTRHALISGAGIGGPALVHQLATRGWQTTVIERFPERRDEGQNIDVRGAAREVARRMGIEDDLLDNGDHVTATLPD